jgi:hypothetical protein
MIPGSPSRASPARREFPMTEGPRASRPPNPDAAPDPPWRLAGSAARRCPRPQLPLTGSASCRRDCTTDHGATMGGRGFRDLESSESHSGWYSPKKKSALHGPRGKSRAMRRSPLPVGALPVESQSDLSRGEPSGDVKLHKRSNPWRIQSTMVARPSRAGSVPTPLATNERPQLALEERADGSDQDHRLVAQL